MTMEPNTSLSADALIDPWRGPYGGLPPLASVAPSAIEEAVRAAIEIKRAEVQAVSANAAPPPLAGP